MMAQGSGQNMNENSPAVSTMYAVPGTGKRLLFNVKYFFKKFWPELLIGVVATILGCAIGVGISVAVFPYPDVAYHVTKLDPWMPWSPCTVSCNNGSMVRRRTIVFGKDAKNECPKQTECLNEKETKDCFSRPCCLVGNGTNDLAHCYHVYGDAFTWDISRALAGRRGPTMASYGETIPSHPEQFLDGELVSIHSQNEHEFIWNLTHKWWNDRRFLDPAPEPQFWLGLKCEDGPTSCYWSDGSAMDFSALPLEEKWPKHTTCVYINVKKEEKQSKVWFLADCTESKQFVSKSMALELRTEICPKKPPTACYTAISDQHLSWDKAAEYNGEFLATIQSQQELDFIIDNILKTMTGKSYWIGLKCQSDFAGQCFWVDGSSLSFVPDSSRFKRTPDFPNNKACVALKKDKQLGYIWYFEKCDKTLMFLKENYPTCSKVGFPMWSEWSDCYRKTPTTCGDKKGKRYRMKWTRYPGVNGCPKTPTNVTISDQKCTPDCSVGRPSAPTKTYPFKDKCQWYGLAQDIVGVNAVIRGSEDLTALQRLFFKFGQAGTMSCAGKGCSLSIRQTIGGIDGFYINTQASYHSFVVQHGCLLINSLADFPCSLDQEANTKSVRYVSFLGRCYRLSNDKTTWPKAVDICNSKGAKLPKYDLTTSGRNTFKWFYQGFKAILDTRHSYTALRRISGTNNWQWWKAGGVKEKANDSTIPWKRLPGLSDGDCTASIFDAANNGKADETLVSRNCDDKLNYVCQSNPYVERVFLKRPTTTQCQQALSAGRNLLLEKRDWRKCRCAPFETNYPLNVPFCYKVHPSKTVYKDFLVQYPTDNDLSSEEFMDLVTIEHGLEEREVEERILQAAKHHRGTEAYDDSCDSIQSDRSRVSINGSCYVLHLESLNYYEATAVCNEGPNGRLAIVSNRFIRPILHSLWKNTDKRQKLFWTDLNALSGNDWSWSDGSSAGIPWASGRPETSKSVTVHKECGIVDGDVDFKLKTAQCLLRHSFICESDDMCKNPAMHWQVIRYKSRCFIVPNKLATFKEAKAYCKQREGGLAVIENITMSNHLKTKLSKNFIGYVSLTTNSSQKWYWYNYRDDKSVQTDQKTPWATGQPENNRTFKAKGACAAANLTMRDKFLFDEKCNDAYGAVCQYGPFRAKHYLIGMYCSEPGNIFSCRWNDDVTTMPNLYRFNMSYFGAPIIHKDYSCVAIEHDLLTRQMRWIMWNCSTPIQPVLEYRRYCQKWQCSSMDKCRGFAKVKQKPAWGKCRLYPNVTLVHGECPNATIKIQSGSILSVDRLETWTTTYSTGCYRFYGAIKDQNCPNQENWCPDLEKPEVEGNRARKWDWFKHKAKLAQISTHMEYDLLEERLRTETGRQFVPHWIGAFCDKKSGAIITDKSTWFSCRWNVQHGKDKGLKFTSTYWDKSSWKNELFNKNKVCVAYLVKNSRENLIIDNCTKELPAILQVDKYFYDFDSKSFVSLAGTFPEFWAETPDNKQNLDKPIVLYMKNAVSLTNLHAL